MAAAGGPADRGRRRGGRVGGARGTERTGESSAPIRGIPPCMSLAPQLSSVNTVLVELTERIGDMAESLSGSDRDDVARVLFEVERSLSTAGRRLEQLASELSCSLPARSLGARCGRHQAAPD